MSARAENAIQQLYEDPGLREDLSDDEVPTMLQWAERQVAKLDTESPDDATFETRFEALRKLLTSINRYIGRRSYSTPEEQTAEMDRIAERAGTLGYTLEEDPMSFEAQGAVDNITAMKALLAKIDGGEDEPSTDTPPDTLEENPMSFEAQGAEGDITAMKTLSAKIDGSTDEPSTDTPPDTLEEDLMSFEAQGAEGDITEMKAMLAKIDGGEDESSTDTPPHTLEEDLMSFEAQSAEDDITEMKALPAKIDDSEDEPTPPPIDLPTIDDFF